MNRIIFTDFDGTITLEDTCWAMVTRFAADGWEEINRLWEEKRISTQECAERTFELFNATPDDLNEMLESIEIDGGFIDFAVRAEKSGDRLYVLSDGYDFCIDAVFKRCGISLPYYANRLMYDGGFKMESPHFNPECGKCGTCKTGIMRQLAEPYYERVYIGDGSSDFCAARSADRVFAKRSRSLLRHCRENGIAVTEFDSFFEISDALGY